MLNPVSDVFDAIDRIAQTSSKNDKVDIMSCTIQISPAHKDRMVQVLDYAINPFKRYYMTLKSSDVLVIGSELPDDLIDGFFAILDRLTARTLSGHAAVEEVTNYISRLGDPNDAWMFIRILNKDLRANMGRGTIKKAFGKDPIPEFTVMRCHT